MKNAYKPLNYKPMKKNYFAPTIIKDDVKVEAGFQTSGDPTWGLGTPGGDIDFNDYGEI